MPPRFPFPHDPIGWFCLRSTTSLDRGQQRQTRLGGHPLILRRSHAGHLQAAGADGRHWPLREVDGLLFAWHHPDGQPPAWQLPRHEASGWLPLRLHRWDLRSHPQEISENSVDTGHFGPVHGYQGLRVLEPVQVEGPLLRTRYTFQRAAHDFGLSGYIDLDISIQVWGLGYSIVYTHIPRLSLHTRQYVLPTPTEAGHTRLRIAITSQRPARWSHLHPALGLLPRFLVERLVGASTLRIYAHEVAQDHRIWEHKTYLHPPILAQGDGPIGRYRAWCRQFYPPERAASA